jgi:hypothetical protein
MRAFDRERFQLNRQHIDSAAGSVHRHAPCMLARSPGISGNSCAAGEILLHLRWSLDMLACAFSAGPQAPFPDKRSVYRTPPFLDAGDVESAYEVALEFVLSRNSLVGLLRSCIGGMGRHGIAWPIRAD